MATSNTMQFIIPSDFKYLGAIDAAVQDLAREMSCSQPWINDFSTALVEATSNAIEHGNKFAKEKIVRISLSLNGERFVVEVTDQGEGFDYESYVSDTNPPDPLSERGRGILIMTAFTDGVKYSRTDEGGITLQLVKDYVVEESAADSSE